MMLPHDGRQQRHAHAEERERRLGQDVVGHDQRQEHQRHRGDVGQQLRQHDPHRPGAAAPPPPRRTPSAAATAPGRGSAGRRRGRRRRRSPRSGWPATLDETCSGPTARPPHRERGRERHREQVDGERPDQVEQPRDRPQSVDAAGVPGQEPQHQRQRDAQERRDDAHDRARCGRRRGSARTGRGRSVGAEQVARARSPGPIGVPSCATTGTLWPSSVHGSPGCSGRWGRGGRRATPTAARRGSRRTRSQQHDRRRDGGRVPPQPPPGRVRTPPAARAASLRSLGQSHIDGNSSK